MARTPSFAGQAGAAAVFDFTFALLFICLSGGVRYRRELSEAWRHGRKGTGKGG